MTNLTKTTSSTEAAVVPLLTEPEMAELEQQIDVDSKAFKRVGLALIRIHEGRGYRLRGYKTFEDYCQARWDFTERQGRRLITAAQTAERVKEATGVEPASESVARVLAPVANDPVVLAKVAEKLGKGRKPETLATATAASVEAAVASVTGKPAPKAAAPKPAPTAKPQVGPQPALPGLGTDDLAGLQGVLTSVRSFLTNHPWLKDVPETLRLVKQIEGGQALLEKLMAATYSAAGPKPKGPTPAAGPSCPECKRPIAPGDPFCGNCGAAL